MKQLLIIILFTIVITGCDNPKYNKTESNQKEYFLPPPTTYNYKMIDSVKLFYRESGNRKNPTIVLLHGYPSSSHSYRNLIPMLSTHYHIIAPDNLGSGYSDHLDPNTTTYTFDLLANYTQKLLDKLEINNYVMYMQDFGAPVGYRMMMNDPNRIDALIVQNANAYLDGLTPKRQDFFRTAQTDTTRTKHDFLYSLTGKDAIINKQYLFDLDSTNINIQSPDAWTHDLVFLNSDKDREIQVQLFQDYNNNLIRYPKWQKMLREHQPKTLIVWGKKDLKFNSNGAKAYLKDLPKAALHLLDAGHFAAEEKTREIAKLILEFLNNNEVE
ncbi:alpha/beta fold hydrolase [Flavivirga jejuensis]|uniref:Alpha/beta hydrolase n=1 Tax=Flavivirga jejuensis TaxID=870487 RepID=A0ABT8WPK8_9FLAO|nr:alpha/beta hydrolase [Flavivirga jejuensis]MDO5975097.1 alpha/beta hydrolase [Flavivirga jejuensis]